MIEWNFTSGEAAEIPQAPEKRGLPLQLLDRGRQALAKIFLEEARVVACDEPVVSRPQRLVAADQPHAQALQPATVELAAPVRRGDEHDAANPGQRLDQQGLAEEVAILRFSHELLERPVAHLAPQAGPALDDHHLGQQSAHAVADQDHPVE